MRPLLRLLNQHEVEFGFLKQNLSIKGYDYEKQAISSTNFEKGALVVPTQQVKGKMLQVWFEPKTELQDSLTYDITAWSLPYAFGLKAVGTKNKINYEQQKSTFPQQPISLETYAWGTSYDSFEDGKFLAALLKANIKLRISKKPFSSAGKYWKAGSLYIIRGENTNNSSFENTLNRLAKEFQKQLIPIATGYASKGPDMGSDSFQWIKKPKIAVLTEGKISPYAYGELWHYFEQDLNYPFHQIRVSQLSENVMKKIDVLIMPSGLYPGLGSEPKKEMMMRWLNQGGRIIAIERALSFFEDQKRLWYKKKGK